MAKQQRPVVPQFGNWDGQNNIPYTIYFDEARKAKNGGKMMNPNDPMEYIPGMFPSSPPAMRSENVPEEPIGQRAVKPTTMDSQSRENGDMKFTDGPLSNDNKRPVIPQFGNWEGQNNTPYTIYFDEARKAKNGGKMINPNDPMEYPGMFPSSPQAKPSRARYVPEEPIGGIAVRPTMIDSQSRENGAMKKYTDGPPNNDNVNRQRGTGSTHQNRRDSGSGSGQPGRQNGGSVHSIDRSPLHQQAKRNEKISGSPARESKHSNGSGNATPGRSRMKPVSPAIKYPVKGAAVPRFGEWDENNPASGNNYTHEFNIARHEKNSGSPMISNATATRPKQNDRNNYKSLSRCFPCFGK